MKKLITVVITLFCLFIVTDTAFTQSLNDLKVKKQKIEKEIIFLNSLIKKNEQKRVTSLSKLSLLNRKIEVREELINTLNAEVKYNSNLYDNNVKEVNKLSGRMEVLSKEYASILYYSWKNKTTDNKLVFILASKDINQAYKRIKYFKQFSSYTLRLSRDIENLKDSLSKVNNSLKEIIQSKNKLLSSYRKEKLNLANEKQSYRHLVNQLERKKRNYSKELARQKRQNDRLQREIRKVIELNRRKAKRTAGYLKLAKQFASNKGKLPWPVSSGFISSTFGLHPHPISKRAKVRNDGIDITTSENAACLCVFEGVVSEVFNFPGLNNIIMVRHGSYLTVYANLKDVTVSKGDRVKTGQPIGIIYTDPDDNKTVLKFQLWHENNKMNPQYWLVK